MSIIEHSCISEQFVSSCEDLFLSTTPKETFNEIEKYLKMNGIERQIDELQYKLVLKDIIIQSLKKKNLKYKEYHDMWESFINSF